MNKRIVMDRQIIVILIMVLALLPMGCDQPGQPPLEIWVSADGSDQNAGTENQPLQNPHSALRMARELRRLHDSSVAGGVIIVLKEGVYRLEEPLLIRPEDSGSPTSPTIIRAEREGSAVLSGGMPVQGWKLARDMPGGLPAKAEGKIWSAKIPIIWGAPVEFRQLWVDGVKAERASNLDDEPLDRILSVDKLKEEIWIPAPRQDLEQAEQLEFVIHQWWAIANLRVKDLELMGDSARLTFHQPESRIEFEHPWPAPFIDTKKEYNGNSAFYLANDIAFLDRPGEWYLDPDAGLIYYWPRENEDMNSAEVVVPLMENLVQIEGSLDAPVKHVRFEGLRFEHTTWLRPSREGHVPLQAGMYLIDAYKLAKPGTPDKASLENQAWIGRQPAAVSLKGTEWISFHRCRFGHLAATGLDLVCGTSNDVVEGCIFQDIGGTAIQMGFFGNAGFEAHLLYDPSDQREICRFERIANNLITDCTNEDWGCVGISVGYAQDIFIEHNELSHLNYSGICLGWGWTKTINCMRSNRVHANYIHHFAKQMYDVGGIYTLSAQPGTVISNNRIEYLEKAPYAHIPEHYQYIYLDEGSSYIKVVDNWTEEERFFSNTPGPGNEWINNGPQVSEETKNAAGLKEEFRDLLDKMK